MDKLKTIISYIQEKMTKKFYGQIVINFESGHIVTWSSKEIFK